MNMWKAAAIGILMQGSVGFAAEGDIIVAPNGGGGHDLNHSPVGQTFVAVAPDVSAGIFIADQSAAYANGSYPYPVRQLVNLKLDLYAGSGISGAPLYSATQSLVAPFSNYVDVNYAAAGVRLVPGQTYTLVMTDLDPSPGNVSGWTIPSVIDNAATPVNGLQPGAYADGQPLLQGVVINNDMGIGDNAFHVITRNSCAAPAGAKSAEGSGLVTAVSGDRFYLLLREVRLGECLVIKSKSKNRKVKIGDVIEFHGYRSGTIVTATSIEIR